MSTRTSRNYHTAEIGYLNNHKLKKRVFWPLSNGSSTFRLRENVFWRVKSNQKQI